MTSNPAIIDDKSPHCIPFILSLLKSHLKTSPSTPFIIGLNGIQGAGKTTLVSTLSTLLSSPPNKIPTLVLSIDDFYLPHSAQITLASSHPNNKLLQHRGEPGTHDIELAARVFSALKQGNEVKIPQYDKSAFSGSGDRVPIPSWKTVNSPGTAKIGVVIFEGWCVGFSPLSPSALQTRISQPSKTLEDHAVEDLQFVNEKLKEYEVINEFFDAFIHIDANDTEWVYEWRLEQEEALRKEGKGAMSVEQVMEFVDGYFPAYELYTEALRAGIFKGKEGREGRQLRLVVGRDRRVKEVIKI